MICPYYKEEMKQGAIKLAETEFKKRAEEDLKDEQARRGLIY